MISYDIESSRALINAAHEVCASDPQRIKRFSLKYCAAVATILSIAIFAFVVFQPESPESTLRGSRKLQVLKRELRAPLSIGVADTIPVEQREQEINANIDIVVKFQGVETLSYEWLVKPNLDKGKKVVMVIEFKSDSYTNLDRVANGEYDSYLQKFIDEMLADGNREVSIRPLHEFNGDWYPWGTWRGGSNTPEMFKQAFRHVAYVFKNRGANVKIQLDYNCGNPIVDATPFETWFPGEDVVDMILCNGYNRTGLTQWNTEWVSFEDTISYGYNQIASLPGNKPLGIGETSTTDQGDKTSWFRDSFQAILYKFPLLQEVDFFLINKYDGNWDLNSQSQRDVFGQGVNMLKYATQTYHHHN